jgi:predicted ATPase
LLIERRKLLHERVAVATESLYAERLDDHLSQLAHHYSCSANTRRAVHFLGRAGRQAAARSAYSEALAFLTQARLHSEGLENRKMHFVKFSIDFAA